MQKHHNIHDRYIKAVFSDIENAKTYFRDRLPPELAQKIDLDKVRQVSGSFIDQSLKSTFADILFEAPLLKSGNSIFINILIEFKSTKDKYTTIQIGHYIFSALWRQVQNRKEPKPILPVLFYHGRDPWKYHTHRSLYRDLDEVLLKYIPDFEYVYDDLQGAEEAEILRTQSKIWGAVKLLLKYAWDEDYLIDSVGSIFMRIKDGEGNIMKESFVYLFNVIKNQVKVMDAIESMSDLMQREARSAYEEILKEGYSKGREEGRRQTVGNFFNNGISVEIISASMGLTEEEVIIILREDKII